MEKDVKIIKEEHHWTSDEKLKFCGYGEWVEEADFFNFEYLGYEACVLRIMKREPFAEELAYFGGHLCGYVRIPEDHPYFQKEDIDLECHGGLTFNEIHEEHWIGFDCAHSGDIVPTSEKFMKENINLRDLLPLPNQCKHFPGFTPKYKNMEYCINECMEMINQLIEVEKINEVKNEKKTPK